MSSIELIARGIAWDSEDQRRVLICQPALGGYAYLPGGHVEFGESAEAALRREMMEETGLEVDVGALIGVCESSFVQNGRTRHEVNLLFHMKHPWPDPVKSRESRIRFQWLEVDAIGGLRLLPTSVGSWIRTVAGHSSGLVSTLLLSEMLA